ncbi:MAG: carboxylating nicotinate-nucleotide diphosphorylase [Chlorobi bacterium]|nr:carboxylating nicotinate-nucleotide diphosphorylase [Chlorobiota bacterium]
MDNLDQFLDHALREDIGDGDHTSKACIPDNIKGSAHLLIKDHGILAGVTVAQKVFEKIDKELRFALYFEDGNPVQPGDIVFDIQGNARSILLGERLALNIMQHMSGIATQTKEYVNQVKGLKTIILDTRKTTPGMRFLDKEAVRIGGGENHRMGLYDMIMIKDNHIDYLGSIEDAINAVTRYLKEYHKSLHIVIEARDMENVHRILDHGGINRIMFDNFSLEDTREAVRIIDGRFETESSGRITLENVRAYALCGVDYISIGALTHQIKSLDMSLKAVVK